MEKSRWQRYRQIEQGMKQSQRLSGELCDLLASDEKQFHTIISNTMNLSSGEYYEFLFSCILKTVLGDQFIKSSIRDDITQGYDAIIAGKKCDFTMRADQKSLKRKREKKDILIVAFPHRSYHKGTRIDIQIVDVVIKTVQAQIPEIVIDQVKIDRLKRRLEPYAFNHRKPEHF